MQYQEVYSFIIDKLEKELPSYLTYHNSQHTKDVVNAAQHIAESEKISVDDTELLLTASLFHDTGFLKGYDNHEASSSEFARDILPKFNYDKDQVEKICKLIMVTKLPQQPAHQLEEILCDADLFYLGSDKYFDGAQQLYEEFKEAEKIEEHADWNKVQIDFLKKHRYFTLTAVKERDKKKKENLQHLLIKQELQKTLKNNTHPLYSLFQDFFLIIIGILSTGFAMKSFLVPNHFFDGGVSGVSLLLREFYHWNLAYIVFIANLPFIIFGWFSVGKRFALKTAGCIALLSICILFFPFPVITSDKLLISIFGGFFIGLGIGLIMRAGCALDGVEVLALYTFKRTSFTVTEITLAINICIFLIAGFKLGPETAMYSVLTYFTATKTIDFVVEGIEAYTGVTIISGKSELIKYRLVNELNRGITVYKGERGFLPGQFETHSDCDIIFTVVTRLELRKLKNVVHETDPKAFVFANTIKEASGGILRRRQVH